MPELQTVLHAIRKEGGRALYVGGCVRDHFMSRVPKDIDVEVYGLQLGQLQEVLSHFGTVDLVGMSFGVLKLHGLDVDFSIPRKDNKVADGHRGFEVSCDPFMSVKDAARRRDLTINSIAMEFTGIEDPFNGVEDIKNQILRPTDPATFLEDPLRALRVAQFISRLGFKPTAELLYLCSEADLSQLPGERVFAEFTKLLSGPHPDRGLEFLRTAKLLRFFPEFEAMAACEQDPSNHAEGDVFTHTAMALSHLPQDADMVTRWTVLCHDFGKPVTRFHNGHKVCFYGHDKKGVPIVRDFLNRLRAPGDLTAAVCQLVEVHLAVFQLHHDQAGPGAFRRLARKLDMAGATMEQLMACSHCDHHGRIGGRSEEAQQDVVAWFRDKATLAGVRKDPPRDVVLGRHLLARGLRPGPDFSVILEKCRSIQFDEGLVDPSQILDRVLQ